MPTNNGDQENETTNEPMRKTEKMHDFFLEEKQVQRSGQVGFLTSIGASK
jgi:hypothetical protein